MQDTLTTRDSAVARLEGELKASSEIIGNIQRDIRRLSVEGPVLAPDPCPPPAPEVVVKPPRRRTIAASATRLLVRAEGEAEIVHVINKKATAIGRATDNDIQIDTKYISRHHARIVITRGATIIEDLGSTNGVFVNERRINRRKTLADGDFVIIGKTQYRFSVRPSERG